jgi:cysteine desulfurase/selenocysteine lyase
MKHTRADFPILKEKINGELISYLDNASTSQKPNEVLRTITDFYATKNANISRGIHLLGEQATALYEATRVKVAQFIGAQDASEIVFTSGTTEGINFVANTWAYEHIYPGDEIIVTELEHHANLLPWQRLAKQKGAVLRAIPITQNGMLDMEQAQRLITKKTKIVAVTQCSNAIGTQVDVGTIIKYARAVGAKVLIDAAQSVAHRKINVHNLDCDFLVFSGHKMLGPTGVGVLYIKKSLHDETPPYQLGGGIVREATIQDATFVKAPQKFEAGTPPIAQVIGLGAAIDYLNTAIDFNELHRYEAELCARTIDGLSVIPGVKILGPLEQLKKEGHLVSFTIKNIHPHDVAEYLSQKGICVRAGNHCAQPLFHQLEAHSSVRASYYFYNTLEDVDRLITAVDELVRNF